MIILFNGNDFDESHTLTQQCRQSRIKAQSEKNGLKKDGRPNRNEIV